MTFIADIIATLIMHVGLALIKLSYFLHKKFKTKLGKDILVIEQKRQEILDQFYENLVELSEDELEAKNKTKQQYDA